MKHIWTKYISDFKIKQYKIYKNILDSRILFNKNEKQTIFLLFSSAKKKVKRK